MSRSDCLTFLAVRQSDLSGKTVGLSSVTLNFYEPSKLFRMFILCFKSDCLDEQVQLFYLSDCLDEQVRLSCLSYLRT